MQKVEDDMMKENVENFLEKVESTPVLDEKMDTLKQQDTEQLVRLAGKSEVRLTSEESKEYSSLLEDDQLKEVSGGWNPRGPIFP